MSKTRLTILTCAFIGGIMTLGSCGTTTVRYRGSTRPAMKQQGPPPHAPAHGYRHKHGDVDLVFRSELGVYIVDGHSGCYFSDGTFYRSHNGSWQISATIEGPWKTVSESKVPKGLQKRPDKGKKNKKNKK